MPELPDVEGFRRVFAEHAADGRVEFVDVLDDGVLNGVSARRLRSTVRGMRFGEPWRHGKWLVAPVGGGAVLLHFGMTGSLHWADRDAERHEHDRLVLGFDSGELRYRDMRKLKGLQLAKDDDAVDKVLADLGPDALAVSREQFRDTLMGLRRQVKTALTDQSVLAGLGNLLADEVLWRARTHPRLPCSGLARSDITRVHRSMGSVLRQAIPTGRVPPRPSWLTGHRDEPDGVCPRCGTRLAHGRVGGRGTVWCPHCQNA